MATSAATSDVLPAAQALSGQLIAWRRHLHKHPELSFEEEQTARYVARELRGMGCAPTERFGDTWGVTALLGPDNAPAVALRADMDALPITEETGLEFASVNPGVMHACGHDAHTAMLLGAARLLKDRQDQLRRPVKLIFQPAEELPPGGAAALIRAGVLTDVACIFGLHVWSEMPLRTLGTRPGPFMSSVNDLKITVRGTGGHAAMPHQCVDPVVVGAELVSALQSVVSRSVAPADSAVVSITQFHAGRANNIIAPTAELAGTIRTLSEGVRATVVRRVQEIAAGIGCAHRAEISVEVFPGYPALVNNAAIIDQAIKVAQQLGLKAEDLLTLPVQGGAEDFACYAERVPAAFLFLGARNAAKDCCHPHHHPRFDIDEDVLPLGAALLAQFALASA
jgi:amidohydrolase